MQALTVEPGVAASAALTDVPRPGLQNGEVLVRALEVGICGTDTEILAGNHGALPPGEARLIIGHECVGVVEESPAGCAVRAGDHVVPIVRRPDPVPCASCAVGEWDMCRNGLYTECGIRARHGFCATYFSCEETFLIPVDSALAQVAVLLEPTSIVAKAWEQIERIGSRTSWAPRRVLITGAGPVGLLAAMLGRQYGFEVHVLDRETQGPKAALTRALGAEFHGTADASSVLDAVAPDIILECTGADSVVLSVLTHNPRGAIVCLVGVSAGGRTIPVDVGALNRSIVLENDVVFGSVNANRRHYVMAAQALSCADLHWLASIITRRVPIQAWREAFTKNTSDVKVVLLPSPPSH